MFPPELATDLFSLEPGHLPDGLPAMTFSATVDTATGALLDMRISPSAVGDIVKLTYDDVDATLGGGQATAAAAVAAPDLHDLLGLAHKLRARRKAAGAMAFTLPKVRARGADSETPGVAVWTGALTG